MNLEESKDFAKQMTFEQAIHNCLNAKGISYRQATKIKLNELLFLAKIVDNSISNEELVEYLKTVHELEVLDKTTKSKNNVNSALHFYEDILERILVLREGK